jgi:alpha-L-rhamnosidase
MKKILKTTPLLFVCVLLCAPCVAGSIKIENPTCEYLSSPEGLDVAAPRFSWTLAATDPADYGQAQSAYRIEVADGAAKTIWDSGWVASNDTQLIPYEGPALSSDSDYRWRVRVKDQNGKLSPWGEWQSWTTGLFDQSEWSARWIGSDEMFDISINPDCNISDPWFRKNVQLKKRPARAMMFVASVGYHELYVNGQKVGDHVLAPNVSDHTTRARYIAYDIAPYLHKGENTVALWLGASWSIFQPYMIGDKPLTPIVIAQADVYYDKNSPAALRITTDSSWKTHPSPNKLLGKWGMRTMGGELWDAGKEIADWNLPSFDDSVWDAATEYTPTLKLSAQNTHPNRLFEKIVPVSVEQTKDGAWRVNMGVNFAGWTEIKVTGNPGDRIDILFSERAGDEMTFDIRSAYIVGPLGKGYFRNRFNYSSGRWITIKGLKEKPALTDICGWQVRTDYPSATEFECADDLQNWIYNTTMWTFRNLSVGGYIVDCPQRERLGYGGDAHATSETGLFNYSLGSFYTKWMGDWRDVQGWATMMGGRVGGGILPHTAPTNNGGGGPSWGGIVVTLPWFMYEHYGDVRILEENFELITGWLEFLDSHTENGILKRWGGQWDYLADWLWPGATAEGMNNDKPQAECFNSSYYAFNLATAAKIAEILGREGEAAEWRRRADETRRAVHTKYYNADDHSYSDHSMGNLALALIGEVPPPELREDVMRRLETEILINCNGHIDVGITGGAMLFKLLRDEGRDDLLWSMTSQTEYPGWGFMRANDATTMWEMWEKELPDHSLLHSSYLYPGAWYIDGVAGIRRDPAHPGFTHFIVRTPRLVEEQLPWARASFGSPVGTIISDWKYSGGSLTHKVVVPPNASATVMIPEIDGKETIENSGYAVFTGSKDGYLLYEVPAGQYIFSQQ